MSLSSFSEVFRPFSILSSKLRRENIGNFLSLVGRIFRLAIWKAMFSEARSRSIRAFPASHWCHSFCQIPHYYEPQWFRASPRQPRATAGFSQRNAVKCTFSIDLSNRMGISGSNSLFLTSGTVFGRSCMISWQLPVSHTNQHAQVVCFRISNYCTCWITCIAYDLHEAPIDLFLIILPW